MREIKFRAWLDSCKTMLYGITVYPDMIGISVDEFEKYLGDFESGYEYDGEDVVTTDGEFTEVMTTLSGEDWVFIEPKFYTVEQYTGLKDKNGKEIYESDILKHHGIVAWNDTEHCWSRIDLTWNDKREWHNIDSLTSPFEVIGNIHQNPELL